MRITAEVARQKTIDFDKSIKDNLFKSVYEQIHRSINKGEYRAHLQIPAKYYDIISQDLLSLGYILSNITNSYDNILFYASWGK